MQELRTGGGCLCGTLDKTKTLNLSEQYNKYLEERTKIELYEIMLYDWVKFPTKISPILIVYKLLIEEHARELANSINEMKRIIVSLKAWGKVLGDMNDQEKLDLLVEFIYHSATVGLNLPYVIRSRFIYSVAHLCHQANQIKQSEWKDDLPIDEEIYFQEADNYGSNWNTYTNLKVALEQIGNKEYNKNTCDFRNKYNHRYSPMIEIGLANFVTRNVDKTKRVSYGMGFTEPLKLTKIVDLLKVQHEYCTKSFTCYQMLVNEHIECMKQDVLDQ